MSTDYFSWKNFSELADLNGHIAFATDVIQRHQWQPAVLATLKMALERIVTKQNDKKLNVSVIGEFSTGKSTFINALLRRELLAASALQGTTVAVTVIEHTGQNALFVSMANGKQNRRQFRSVMEMHDMLYDLTTNPATAQQLHVVGVELMSESLEKGIRIIDTPGTNATEQWHEQVTRRAIRELSDLSVILVDATRPLPQTLCTFIGENLSDVLEQCIFVVTKIDLVRAVERPMLINYIKKKTAALGCPNALVLPYVAPAVIHAFAPGSDTFDNDELRRLSMQSEEQLYSHTARQRLQAQARKLITLTTQLYDSLTSQVKKMAEECEHQLEVLTKTLQTDLAPFIAQQKTKRQQQLATLMEGYKLNSDAQVNQLADDGKKHIMTTVLQKPNLDQLKQYMTQDLAKDCAAEAQKMAEAAQGTQKDFRECFRQVMNDFQTDFEKLFTDLKILQIDFGRKDFKYPEERQVDTVNLNDAAQFVSSELSKENWAFLGGAAAGAVVGTMIAPGVGTVIGAVAGFVFGGNQAPKIEKVRSQLSKKMTPLLDSFFNKTISTIGNTRNEYMTLMQQNIVIEIDRYLDSYQAIVNQRIVLQRQQRAKVEQQINSLNSELAIIAQRRQSLMSIAQQLH